MTIKTTTPSTNIQVHLPDGRTLEGPRGASAEAFLQAVQIDSPAPIVGAIINGDLHELTYVITMESRLEPVTMADADGSRIYRRSLTFLLEAAFSALFPKAILLIDHSVASGGYYCHVHGHDPLTEQELANLETEMRRMLDANLPFVRQEVTLAEAIAHFEAQGYQDKVRLFAHRRKPYVTLYRLGEHLDYHHGYMVPTTGYLKWFALAGSNGGFTLRFPRRQNPTAFSPLEDFPKLLAAFRQYGGWLERLGTDSVGALNDAIHAGRARELILVSEALHEQHIAALASQIAERGDARLVLIAGPSSSGKTTFARRLAVQLLARGLSPFALEMDNYFVDRDDTPKDENGEFDFETIEALNLKLLGEQLEILLAGQEVQIPRYNFRLGKSEPGDVMRLRPGQLIILEGIHGLNPRLIPASLARQSFRLYASALTQLNLDRHNRVSTTDTRLIRRIVRDARERGYSAAQTISRWESVRRGEKRHIFPYQENTDVMFNSALAYEMSVLRPLAEPLLRQVAPHTPEFIETKRLLAFLEWFLPLESDLVPDNSILREFIGGSILKGFKVWGG
ncbi:MAG: nucleoside kinase [Anaerolineae bacterium]|nr:nucleoside kinase [Anaerolineae bacterium]